MVATLAEYDEIQALGEQIDQMVEDQRRIQRAVVRQLTIREVDNIYLTLQALRDKEQLR